MLHLAIPSMNEADFLPNTLGCIHTQQFFSAKPGVHLWVCVNQPESYREDIEKLHICENNRKTLELLQNYPAKNLHVIDRSSPGKGWTGKDHGVGMARKVLMDQISEVAAADDIIVSMDADSFYPPGYLASVLEAFRAFPDAVALSNPYYHPLTGDETLDRAMLRYEIYMRYYAINMWRIGSPFSFTALGSALALPVWAYRKIGGMTAKKSGEDFYLLQKLRKTGYIINHNTEKVYPGTRYSDRVFFGTGPALIKGSKGLWDSYPIYDYDLFNKVGTTYELFSALYKADIATPMDNFLAEIFKTDDIFGPLRKNASNEKQFIKASHHKIDGLRVLQFLKSSQTALPYRDEDNLSRFLQKYCPEALADHSQWHASDWQNLDFNRSSIAFLDIIRNFLMKKETMYQNQP
jgi:glycosyltransferase involved in cell wall biosynthesis